MAAEEEKQQQSLCFDRKKRKRYSSLLEEWYGSDAPGEVLKHLPKSQDMRDVLAKLTKQLVPPWIRAIEMVTAHWQEIVGEAGAKRLTPLRFDGTTLLLELKHPAYRMAFDSPAVRETIIRKINGVAQSEICKAIKFVAPGMFAKK